MSSSVIYRSSLAILLTSASTLLGQTPAPAKAEEPKPVIAKAKRFEEMNYGQFLSASFHNAEGKTTIDSQPGTANKGIAIKLPGGNGTMLFDTDLCRMAGGWTGGWIKLKGVIFDGGHGANPQPAEGANFFFQTNPGPGWAKGSDFSDPRKLPTGPGAAKVPFGPLPKDQAKYRGLYVNGDKTVLAYTVGEAQVLELPAIEKVGDVEVLTRTFQILGPGAATALLLADGAQGVNASVEGALGVMAVDGKNPDARMAVGVVGLNGAKVVADAGRLVAHIPALAAGQTFKVAYWRGPAGEASKAGAVFAKLGKPEDLKALTKGGASHWKEQVEVEAQMGKDDGAYTVDTIPVPFENAYKSWMRIGALDFFKDGSRAAVTTWSGDVWVVSGLGEQTLGKVTWKRYATGLFQPLGCRIIDEKVYVLGRDQITRLHDLNADGEADLYENFNNDVQVTPGFHEFAFDLQTDAQGNFYFSKGGPVNPGGRGWGPLSDHSGCIFRVSRDGAKFEVFATGVRAPNGIGVGPKGEVTVGDNQGTWVPACYIHFVKQGEFVGVTDLSHRDPLPTDYSRHLCFLPMSVDNSGGGQVWVTSEKWGPLKDRLLHMSYGKGTLLGTLIEEVGGVKQGGAFKMPVKFESGTMRGRFNAKDGQLYVTGLKGWQTSGAKDGALQRVRYTGKEACVPATLNVNDKGIRIGFTTPLDKAGAADVQNYSIEQWNYRWSQAYGSDDFKVSDPNVKGRDPVEVKSVQLAADGKSVFLEVPGLQPVMQMRIKLNLKSASGSEVPNEIVNTINVVPKA